MRKLALALCCVLGISGLVISAEVTLVKYDSANKEVTVKEGEKEATYKFCDKTHVTFVDKEGSSKEGTVEAAVKMLSSEKAKGKLKFEIQLDNQTITELKLKYRRK